MSASDADVEAVARAIYNEPGPDGDALAAYLSDGGVRLTATTAPELRAEVMNLCRIAARAAIAALPSREDAMPIETAPKSGCEILVFAKDRWRIGYWEIQRYHKRPVSYWHYTGAWGVADMRACPPTHWRPLPDIPSPAKPDGGDRG